MFELKDFSVRFGALTAVRNATLTIAPGQTLGLVGESGSGKTILGLSLMGMTPDSADLAGQVSIDGQDMTHATEATWQALRARRMAMIFQEPMPRPRWCPVGVICIAVSAALCSTFAT